MRFEWDSKKAEANKTKHKVSFEEAMSVFADPFSATFEDTDHSAGEERYVTIGTSIDRLLLVVCHTERRNATRIISAWKANSAERKKYESEVERRFGPRSPRA